MADKIKQVSSIVKEAKERFRIAKDVYSSARSLAEADTKFAMGDSDNMWQWPEDARNQRETSKRVCLTVNVTAQHCNQIINGIRQNRPAAKVIPVDSGADNKTAEILAGLIKGIHADSSADDAHDTAAEHAVYGGEGYWRVLTEYEDERSFNQVIKVKVCQRPDLVYIDPHCQELDKSDAKWGFIFEDITKTRCESEHPGIDPKSWEDDPDGWCNEDMVRRAEYFYCDDVQDTAYLLTDGSSVIKSDIDKGKVELQPDLIVKERKTTTKKWKWCKLLGSHEEPIEETEWLGSFLPIISVVGKEIYVGSELVRKGIVRDLKDQGRMINYAFSETVQTLALQNKVPYMAAMEAIEGHEDIWDSANVENLTYLPFNSFDDNGNSIPAPSRQLPAVMPAAQIQLLQLSTEQMRAASGQQNANFGIKSEAASGVGIQRLKQQGEVATFHFPDNLARALRYEAKVLIDLIQKYYDTDRVVRIIGVDGKEDKAKLNPQMEQAHAEEPDDTGVIQQIFNPQVGRYDVQIDTGPSYATLRQEAAANLNELAGRQPGLLQVAGDLIMRAQDFPMAEEIAERLEKALPPGLKDEEGQQQAQIPPEMQQQMQQMQQVIQEGSQQVDQLLKEKEAKIPELELKKYEIDKKTAIEEYKAETERIKAMQLGLNEQQVQDICMGMIHAMQDSEDPSGDTVAQVEPQQPDQQQESVPM